MPMMVVIVAGWINVKSYCAIVPLPMAMASGLAMMPNEVFVEADGVSCGKMTQNKKAKFIKQWLFLIANGTQ